MEIDYNLNSDSDEEDPQTESNSKSKTVGNHLHDIEKLKVQTANLLDPSWKELRNRTLLHKMLDLEEPTITPKVWII